MTPTKPLRLLVAINPSASFGRGAPVGPFVVRGLRASGHTVTAVTEASYADLRAATRAALAEGQDALTVVGGDGMVSLGTTLVAGTGIPLGIVPSGTGNDLARGLGIPLADPAAALAVLEAALLRPPRPIDIGEVRHADGSVGRFAGVLAAGFDAVVNERANRMTWPKGPSRYNLALLRELATLRPIAYRIELDGVTLETRAMLVSVGNNTSIGGGMMVTPHALLDDGLLDVLVVRPLSRLAFLRIFPRVFSGRHVTDPRVTVHRAARVRIDADGVVAYADGERMGPLPIDVSVVPGSLLVLAPRVGPPPVAAVRGMDSSEVADASDGPHAPGLQR